MWLLYYVVQVLLYVVNSLCEAVLPLLCGFLHEAMSISLPMSNYYPGFTRPEEPA